jgi:CRISPR-associated endonuclease Cas2
MTVYLIAYDLINEKKGTFDYEPLWAELKKLGGFRTQYSLWLANLSNTAKEVCDHFQKFVDKDDRIWVTHLRKDEYHYVNAIGGTNKWLADNPPT